MKKSTQKLSCISLEEKKQRPCSSFTKEDMHLMNQISNLQPLWAEDNIKKSNKY